MIYTKCMKEKVIDFFYQAQEEKWQLGQVIEKINAKYEATEKAFETTESLKSHLEGILSQI